MTPVEQNNHDPMEMLENRRHLKDSRACRMFATACCRRIWNHLPDHLQQAVLIAEQFAAGNVDERTRAEAGKMVDACCIYVDGDSSAADRFIGFAAEAVLCCLYGDGDYPPIPTYATTCAIAASRAVTEVIYAKAELDGEDETSREESLQSERRWRCAVIRHLFSQCDPTP
jgi:hypothetical protein